MTICIVLASVTCADIRLAHALLTGVVSMIQAQVVGGHCDPSQGVQQRLGQLFGKICNAIVYWVAVWWQALQCICVIKCDLNQT